MKGNRFEVGDRVRVLPDWMDNDLCGWGKYIKAGEEYTITRYDESPTAPYKLNVKMGDYDDPGGWFSAKQFELVGEEEGAAWTTP